MHVDLYLEPVIFISSLLKDKTKTPQSSESLSFHPSNLDWRHPKWFWRRHFATITINAIMKHVSFVNTNKSQRHRSQREHNPSPSLHTKKVKVYNNRSIHYMQTSLFTLSDASENAQIPRERNANPDQDDRRDYQIKKNLNAAGFLLEKWDFLKIYLISRLFNMFTCR